MKLLLCSHAGTVIDKADFLFPQPVSNLKTICITTAANVYADDRKGWLHDEMQSFTKAGFQLIEYDLKDKTRQQVIDKLSDADVIYVTGGNSYYLLEHMVACDFETILRDRLADGALYIGSSAGMVVACPSIDFIGHLDDPAQANLTDYTGLGLIDFNLMPHTDHPKYKDQISQLILDAQKSGVPILGLKDSQALYIDHLHYRIL